MTDKQQNCSKDTDGNILFPSEPGAGFTSPAARTQRPRAAVRRAARRGIMLAAEAPPQPTGDIDPAVLAERARCLSIVALEKTAERIGLLVNASHAIEIGAKPSAVHIELAQFAREDGRSDAEIAAAGLFVLHRGRV